MSTTIDLPPAPPDLKHKLKLGLLWNTGINLFRDVLQFGVMLVMVRLLDPNAYGQFGLVNSFMGFFTILSFLPFVEHSLQPRSNEQVNYQLYFTVGLVINPAVFVALNLLAWGLRYIPDYAAVAPLLHVTSFLFLLAVPHELRTKMLERALDWHRLRSLQAMGLVLSAALGIVLAAAGLGVYALVVPPLMATAPFIYDLLFVKRWRPTLYWDAAAFRPARQYGLSRITTGVLTNGRVLLEGSVLVHVVGYNGFGIYGRAMGLAALTCLRLPTLLMQTVYPVLTKIEQGTDAYRRANSLVLRTIAWSVIPLAALLSILAGPLIHALYGEKWIKAIPLLPWALAATVAMAMMQTVESLMLANCQQARYVFSEITICAGVVLSLAVFLPHGPTVYLVGVGLAYTACLGLTLHSLHKGKAITWGAVAEAFAPSLTASAAAFGACFLLRQWLPGVRDLFFTQFAFGLVFVLVCAIVLRAFFPNSLKELTEVAPFGSKFRRLLFL